MSSISKTTTDADTVDGEHASDLVPTDGSREMDGALEMLNVGSGPHLTIEDDSANPQVLFKDGNDFNTWDFYFDRAADKFVWRASGTNVFELLKAGDLKIPNGGLTIGGSSVLTVADEGAGNGLDADMVDGSHASDFGGLTDSIGTNQSVNNVANTSGSWTTHDTIQLTNGVFLKGYVNANGGSNEPGRLLFTWEDASTDEIKVANGSTTTEAFDFGPANNGKRIDKVELQYQTQSSGPDYDWKFYGLTA